MLRRNFLSGLSAAATLFSVKIAWAETTPQIRALKVGSFIWRPELSPDGPVVVVVSLPEQLVHVYRNGFAIGVSTCSTGKPGHKTPTGVFTILQKRRKHFSSTYNNAPMPNMQRLTWRGIALHAGNLPGYPASHGCVRLPKEFSRHLFKVTHLGTSVIIADQKTEFGSVVHPKLILDPGIAALAATAGEKKMKKQAGGWSAKVQRNISTILVSAADRQAYLLIDGELTYKTPIRIKEPNRPLGHNLYSLIGWSADKSYLEWHVYGFHKHERESTAVNRNSDPTLSRIEFVDKEGAKRAADTLLPGTTMVITDFSANPETRSGPDFTVMVEDRKITGKRRPG